MALSERERRVLAVGLNSPTYIEGVYKELDNYFNRLRWKDFWSRRESKPPAPLWNSRDTVKIGPPDKEISKGLVDYIARTRRAMVSTANTFRSHSCFYDWRTSLGS